MIIKVKEWRMGKSTTPNCRYQTQATILVELNRKNHFDFEFISPYNDSEQWDQYCDKENTNKTNWAKFDREVRMMLIHKIQCEHTDRLFTLIEKFLTTIIEQYFASYGFDVVFEHSNLGVEIYIHGDKQVGDLYLNYDLKTFMINDKKFRLRDTDSLLKVMSKIIVENYARNI